MPLGKLPWFEYSGQPTAEILAYKATHRIDSLLRALEEAIQLRQSRTGNTDTTPAEVLLLAVMSLEREVNNGGFAQFFVNSSRQYASRIVEYLQRIDCAKTAALAEEAIGCLGLKTITPISVSTAIRREDPQRDERLEALDREFYQLSEIGPNLFRFVDAHKDEFILERMPVSPREKKRGITNAGRLALALDFARPTDRSFTGMRKLAAELASAKSIKPTEEELDGSVYLHLLGWFLRSGDLDSCEDLAPRAFQLTREDTTHCVLHLQWLEKLLEASRDSQADDAALQYLTYLNQDDKASNFVRKRVGFFADIVRRYAPRLPRSVQYLRDNFTETDIEPPLVIYKGLRSALRHLPDPLG